MKNKTINVNGIVIAISQGNNSEYISLTDIAKYKDSLHTDNIVKN